MGGRATLRLRMPLRDPVADDFLMLSSISDFFDKHLAMRKEQPATDAAHKTHLAAAALLVEVIQSDDHVSDRERETLLASIADQFDLDENEARELLALAQAEAREATDLHQFTSLINRQFSPEQKIVLIEDLWRAAFADQILHRHEEHLIRRIADLIHVSHSALIAAKHRAQSTR
jgi:uncharacterized tellurite resistance protein B-like protein